MMVDLFFLLAYGLIPGLAIVLFTATPVGLYFTAALIFGWLFYCHPIALTILAVGGLIVAGQR